MGKYAIILNPGKIEGDEDLRGRICLLDQESGSFLYVGDEEEVDPKYTKDEAVGITNLKERFGLKTWIPQKTAKRGPKPTNIPNYIFINDEDLDEELIRVEHDFRLLHPKEDLDLDSMGIRPDLEKLVEYERAMEEATASLVEDQDKNDFIMTPKYSLALIDGFSSVAIRHLDGGQIQLVEFAANEDYRRFVEDLRHSIGLEEEYEDEKGMADRTVEHLLEKIAVKWEE